MGVSYLPSNHFHINHKKTLCDSHCITNADGVPLCMSISQWIDKELLMIWHELYSACGSKRLQLCSDAYNLLISKMQEHYPERYAAHVDRRKKELVRKRITRENS